VAALEAEVTGQDLVAVAADAATRFAQMVDEIPYADQPDHVMAGSILACYGVLAFLHPLRERGYDEHVLGRAAMTSVRTFMDSQAVAGEASQASAEEREQREREALESQRRAAPDEFVFEMLPGAANTDYGMNILSCAVCHAFGKHDAMDLVPYMCATDDVMSDALGQGLRRSGTIALGAHHCDFRFKHHGPPARLEETYPERIRLQAD
jgi:hypothetical protein